MTLPKTANKVNTNQTNRLSVQVSLTGLSFLISSNEGEVEYFYDQKFNAQRNPEELLLELINHLDSNDNFHGQFDGVTIFYATENYTLVPTPLFDSGKSSEYLKFNTKILGNDFISHDTIKELDMTVVYVPLVNINNYIFDRFGSFQYYHASTQLIKQFSKGEKHSEQAKTYIHVLKDQFDLLVFTNGALQLCNTFSYKTAEDFIYYVLFCFEQLKLNPEHTETILTGDIEKGDPQYEILYRYVRSVSFLERALPKLEDKSPHQEFLLKTSV